MATYKVRGIAHNIIYPYRTEDGKVKGIRASFVLFT